VVFAITVGYHVVEKVLPPVHEVMTHDCASAAGNPTLHSPTITVAAIIAALLMKGILQVLTGASFPV
jgi:hypothetical protein